MARKTLGEIDSGKDPTRERDSRRTIPLFADFADSWLRDHVALKRKPATLREYRRIVARNLNPELGKVRIDRVERADALKIHAELAGQRYIANRVVAVLSALMTFAERMGYRQPYSNPCRGLERFRENKRKRPLSRDELASLWAHLESLEGRGRRPAARHANSLTWFRSRYALKRPARRLSCCRDPHLNFYLAFRATTEIRISFPV